MSLVDWHLLRLVTLNLDYLLACQGGNPAQYLNHITWLEDNWRWRNRQLRSYLYSILSIYYEGCYMCLRALSCLTFFARSPRDPRADERTKPLPRAHKKRSIQWSYERERYFTHLQRRIARIRIAKRRSSIRRGKHAWNPRETKSEQRLDVSFLFSRSSSLFPSLSLYVAYHFFPWR